MEINIFETIHRAKSDCERIHSQFLGEALISSSKEDRILFDSFWDLCTPTNWKPPKNPEIRIEYSFPDKSRIDIAIIDNRLNRILGIEVKIYETTVDPLQLEHYGSCIRQSYDDESAALVYLTPFNHDRADQLLKSFDTSQIRSVKEFNNFRKSVGKTIWTKHLSWLDVADIDCSSNPLWIQHCLFVRSKIADHKPLQERQVRDRRLKDFFSKDSLARFWNSLREIGIKVDEIDKDIVVDLSHLVNANVAPVCLAKAFRILITDSQSVDYYGTVENSRETFVRARIPNTQSWDFHNQLLSLSDEFEHVEAIGRDNYGLRVAHQRVDGSVSILTSDLENDRLKFNVSR